MNAEERAEIRARIKDIGNAFPTERLTALLDALDVCEAERDRAVELLRAIRRKQPADWFFQVEDFLASVATEESNE